MNSSHVLKILDDDLQVCPTDYVVAVPCRPLRTHSRSADGDVVAVLHGVHSEGFRIQFRQPSVNGAILR